MHARANARGCGAPLRSPLDSPPTPPRSPTVPPAREDRRAGTGTSRRCVASTARRTAIGWEASFTGRVRPRPLTLSILGGEPRGTAPCGALAAGELGCATSRVVTSAGELELKLAAAEVRRCLVVDHLPPVLVDSEHSHRPARASRWQRTSHALTPAAASAARAFSHRLPLGSSRAPADSRQPRAAAVDPYGSPQPRARRRAPRGSADRGGFRRSR